MENSGNKNEGLTNKRWGTEEERDEYNSISDEGNQNKNHEIDVEAILNASMENDRKINLRKKINNHEFSWLKNKGSERAVFWCWLFIIHEALAINDRNHDLLIRKFYVSDKLYCTKNRIDEIIFFYRELSSVFSHGFARDIYQKMLFDWSEYVNVVRRVRWIENKNEDDLDWIYQYLVNKNEFRNGVLSWFAPLNRDERVRLIIGAIDEMKTSQSYYSDLDIRYKNILLHDMRMAYEQRKRRAKIAISGKRIAINAEVSADVKNKLVTMSKLNNMQINQFLEKIILEEFERFKK